MNFRFSPCEEQRAVSKWLFICLWSRVQFLLALWRLTPLGLRLTSKGAATRGALATFSATIAFGAFHSLLCLPQTKAGTQKLLGPRFGRGLYRLFFNLQSLVTTGALVLFVLSRPARVVYSAPKWARPIHWLVQGSALFIALWSVKELRFRRFSGIEGALDAARNEDEIAQPETQTPDGGDGLEFERGPYKWSRHPLEWAPLVLLWATPLLKTNWLGFNLAATIYMIAGVFAEEKRLEAKSGESYGRYQEKVGLVFGRKKR